MKYIAILVLILPFFLWASEPSKSEKELRAKLKSLEKKFEEDQVAAKRKFLSDAKLERPQLSTRNKARIDAVVIQIELEVFQSELKKWVVGTWQINGQKWIMNEDGTAIIEDMKMRWKVVGEAIIIEEADRNEGRFWYIIEMVGPNSASGKTKDAESFTAERDAP